LITAETSKPILSFEIRPDNFFAAVADCSKKTFQRDRNLPDHFKKSARNAV